MTIPPSGEYVQSLARGLSVIRAFSAESPSMTLADIARATGLTRATARRFLLTLEELGYVRADERAYSLTPRVLELGFSYLSSLSLTEVAQPHLEQLSRAVGESTSASVLDGADIVYIARVPTRRIMTVNITIGTRFPAHATSMGRVLLGNLSADELDHFLTRFHAESLTPRTITTRDALLEELGHVREQGWAMVDQELEFGLRSLAAPVRRAGQVVAAINVSTVAGGSSVAHTKDRLLPELLKASTGITSDLSHY
ncbi:MULTISPECIES: IclR family transcriptional regulator C-terminal domain-containing protein [unclassified Salinibacterium]|uniref:IclR family transcriptional regulator domain-containing protein n=1 Tax=unclassified Salinibacterium TaxID=2632331 RepID=UPI00142177AC|nr:MULTISPECIES: IclR family transcriptional regulator C-terminal domain-containing protein [unclassified Salinibacterium]